MSITFVSFKQVSIVAQYYIKTKNIHRIHTKEFMKVESETIIHSRIYILLILRSIKVPGIPIISHVLV